MDLSILKAELIAGSYSTDAHEAADELNAKIVSAKNAINTRDIKKYMLLNDLWLPIKTSAKPAAIIAVDALSIFDSFGMHDPQVALKVAQMMDALIAAGLLTEPHKAAVLSMSDTQISKAEELGLKKVRGGDVERARALK